MLTRSEKRPAVRADAKAHSHQAHQSQAALGGMFARVGEWSVPPRQVQDRSLGTAGRLGAVRVYDFGQEPRERVLTIEDYEPHGQEFGADSGEGE